MHATDRALPCPALPCPVLYCNVLYWVYLKVRSSTYDIIADQRFRRDAAGMDSGGFDEWMIDSFLDSNLCTSYAVLRVLQSIVPSHAHQKSQVPNGICSRDGA
jgi:hypothetical protein